MQSYFVKPREPTVLSHKGYHEISSTDLLLSMTVPTAHVIPEILDVYRFSIALSGALSNFPHLAGRLVRPGTPDAPWMIRLTNSGVPVSFIDSPVDEITSTDLTVQTPLHLVEPLDVVGIINTDGESDTPLFRMTITRFTKLNSTAIGACSSHVLFDGSGLLMFFRLLSQLYQGLGPIDPPPYYEQEAIKFRDPLETPSHVFHLYDPPAPPWKHPEREAMEFTAFRLTAAQLVEIHNTVTKGMEHLRISRVDVVVAALALCLSEIEPEAKPIDTISYVISHRGMGIYPDNAVANAILWFSMGIQGSDIDPSNSVSACATKIRKSLGRLKNPGFVADMVGGVAKMQSQVSWDRKGQDIAAAKEGHLIVNNTWKFRWTSPHFGHPGKVRFLHGHPPGSRYAKIMTPNPKFVDGMWISREGDMEVTFYVPPNRRKRFEELFEGHTKSLGMTGQVEFLP